METYTHHPLLMDNEGRNRLPALTWHSALGSRYAIGTEAELFRRSQAKFYEGIGNIHKNTDKKPANQPMQPGPEILDNITGPAIDIIAPTVIIGGKAITIIEDHVHQGETSYTMGKSTITLQLLGITPIENDIRKSLGIPPNQKVPSRILMERLEQKRLDENNTIDVTPNKSGGIKLLAGDVTFVSSGQNHRLVAAATSGTREDFAFDISRSSARKLIDDYDRVNPAIMQAQIYITEMIRFDPSIWADIKRPYEIEEFICISPLASIQNPAQYGRTLFGEEGKADLTKQLQKNPLYIAEEIGYWNIESTVHKGQVDNLFSQNLTQTPNIQYLYLRDPKDPSSLTHAADLLKRRYISK